MKIAIYVPSWPPGSVPNGIVTYASFLVPALRRQNHEVFVLTNNVIGDPDPYTIDLRRFGSNMTLLNRLMFKFVPEAALAKTFDSLALAIACAIRYLVENHQIDVFEIEESFGWSYSVSRLNIVPVVVRLHGPWFLMGQFDQGYQSKSLNRRRQNLEGRGIRNAHFVTANCWDTLNAVKGRYEVDLHRSRVLPNPIDTVPEEKIWRLEDSDIDSVLFVGRFDQVKGGDLILRAFGRLATLFPKLRLTFVGPDRGIAGVNGERQSFQQFITENLDEAARSRIDFRGHMSHAQVMSMRTRHFMTLIAAQYDTMGYMMMEAMSLGCPIITTAVGGIPEFIKDERNGLLIPSQNVEAMVRACKLLLENKQLAKKIGRQAWTDCRDLYNSDKVAEQMASTYREATHAVVINR